MSGAAALPHASAPGELGPAPAPIVVRELGKTVPAWDEPPRGLGERLSRRVPALMRFGPQRPTLQDVSFAVPAGGALGVIGGNGAGKSTLLKILAGLIQPSSGEVQVRGTIRSVLALGEAFDLALSATDNALTTARIAGLSRRDAQAALPAIFDFAELARFERTPVRTFSEGMKLRLAMGVISQLDGDVYLVDEVLAVGDAWFQARCLEYFAGKRREGATMVFASHDLDRLAAASDRVLWLDRGRERMLGEPVEVIAAYRQRLTNDAIEITPAEFLGPPGRDGRPQRMGSGEVRIEALRVHADADVVMPGDPLAVDLTLRSPDGEARACHVTISLYTPVGIKAYDATTDAARLLPRVGDDPVDVRFRLSGLPLSSGEYRLEIGVYAEDWHHGYEIRPEAAILRLEGNIGDEGVAWAQADWTVSGERRTA